MSNERRQFERLSLEEKVIAVDDTGMQLGVVSLAGGGGMQIEASSATAVLRMKLGSHLRVTIVEPSSGTTNTIDVEVRFAQGNTFGVQFV